MKGEGVLSSPELDWEGSLGSLSGALSSWYRREVASTWVLLLKGNFAEPLHYSLPRVFLQCSNCWAVSIANAGL